MPLLKMDVPTLAQELSDCCWHTSAMMIWQYWQRQHGRAGPMNTVAPVYAANTGISAQGFITLAKTVGLVALPNQNTFSNEDLFKLLRANGPIWSAGHWYGVGHIIVLTGVDGGSVFFNDPDGGVKKTETLEWFNKKLANGLPGCLMAKDPKAY